jgi:hypothetical protein
MGTWTNFSAAQAAVADRFVTVTDMKRGTYGAPANAGAMPSSGARHVTITLTRNGAVDNPLGTVTITGTNLSGAVITEVITPLDNATATGTKWFKTVTSVIAGATWVTADAADSITVGCGAACIVAEGSGELTAIVVNTTAAGTITVSDANGTIAVLPANVAVGNYQYNVTYSNYLSVILAAASNVTVIHSPSLPQSYLK